MSKKKWRDGKMDEENRIFQQPRRASPYRRIVAQGDIRESLRQLRVERGDTGQEPENFSDTLGLYHQMISNTPNLFTAGDNEILTTFDVLETEEPDVYMGLYDRQKKLNLNIPKEVCIIGAGGIGSWVAFNMGLIGVEKLYIIDYDGIEEHNLNRTPFRDIDIETRKTEALMDLILERRDDIKIRLFEKHVEDLSEMELAELSDSIIIDCRDVLEELPEQLNDNPKVKLGYDGLSVTIMLNPDYNSVWDLEPENRGYQVIPSFLAPCQFLATAITTLLTDPDFNLKDQGDKIITIDLQEHLKELLVQKIYKDD
jgi:hypothetical protein